MRARLAKLRGSDQGSVLVMAMLFLLLMGSMVLAPLAMADTNLRATVSLHQDRSVQYAAQSALSQAIAYFRSPAGRNEGLVGDGTNSLSLCPNATSPVRNVTVSEDGNNVPVLVTCVGLSTANPSVERDVTFTVICSAGSTCPAGATLLTAEVAFYDIPGITPSVWVKSYSVDY